MKKSTFYLAICILFSILSQGCRKDDPTPAIPKCNETGPTTYIKSGNFFDYRLSSPYFNQVVCNFKFVQVEMDCPTHTSSTSLIIQNNTLNFISFDYNINFVLNAVQWNYQGVATIAPISFIDIGVINTNPARVDLAAIGVQCANMIYR